MCLYNVGYLNLGFSKFQWTNFHTASQNIHKLKYKIIVAVFSLDNSFIPSQILEISDVNKINPAKCMYILYILANLDVKYFSVFKMFFCFICRVAWAVRHCSSGTDFTTVPETEWFGLAVANPISNTAQDWTFKLCQLLYRKKPELSVPEI